MARYSHLPIYNTAFELLRELYVRVPKFGKQYKYFLGEKILAGNIEVVRLILQVNNTEEALQRVELLDALLWQSESIIILLRIANELQQLGGEKNYLILLEKSVALSKQAEGWRKSTLSK
jgi:hypothetical protein